MAVDKERMEKLRQYAASSTKKAYALKGWIERNMKPFKLSDALSCIYDFAGGNRAEMDKVIEQLTEKRKTYGRTQVYNAPTVATIDIVRDGDGNLVLRGYNPEHELAPKGQHGPRNGRIFRKSDDQVSKTYQNAVERMYDLGSVVREMYPKEDKAYIQFAMKAIRDYASERKLNIIGVANAIKKGRLMLDDDGPAFKVRPVVREGRTVIIDEETERKINDMLKMTEYKFNSGLKDFLRQLLADPVNAQPCDVLRLNGLSRGRLLRLLLSNGIVEKDERISDKDENGQLKTATMMVKFRVPKHHFDRNVKKLYIRLFEKNVPGKVNEDGEGATSADASGQFSQPLFPMMRRQMPQSSHIDETATTDAGDYQYTVPFPGDDETLARHNGIGGSVSINHAD